MTPHSDEELMQLSCAGKRAAFTLLVERYQQKLLNFFRRMGDYNSEEELVQETFVRLYNYRDRYEPKAKFQTFLYMLARRTWIDYVRKSKRRQDGYQKLVEDCSQDGNEDWRVLRMAQDKARLALASLSEEMRSVVVLSFYEGFKYKEIAEILDVPVGTVKTRMFHAMRRMKEVLENDTR